MNNNNDENDGSGMFGTNPIEAILTMMEKRTQHAERMNLKQDRLLQSARVAINDLTDRPDGINERESIALSAACRKISNFIAERFNGAEDDRIRDLLAVFLLDCVALYRVKQTCDCATCVAEKEGGAQ